MSTIDNVMAYRILNMLVTPFDKTEAFKLGIIDKRGTILKQAETPEEKDGYTVLDRLVFSIKRVIEKIPGGYSKLGSLIAAYWLIKESYETNNKNQYQKRFEAIIRLMESGVILVEEEMIVKKFLEEEIAANNTAGVEVKNPDAVTKKKKYSDLVKRKVKIDVAS